MEQSTSTPASNPRTAKSAEVRNVVVFGETGSGKSSLINMLPGGATSAAVSSTAAGVTFAFSHYAKTIHGSTFRIFDTTGLNESARGSVSPSQAIEQLYKLVHQLEDGISLLVYVMRAPRLKSTMQKNYEIFYEILCQRSIPIVIIVTGLEGSDNMDDWWTNNEAVFGKNKMFFRGHACITSIPGKQLEDGSYVYQDMYDESRKKVEELIYQFRDSQPWTMPSKTWIEDMIVRVHVILAEVLGVDSKVAARDLRFALRTYGGLSRKEATSRAKSLEITMPKPSQSSTARNGRRFINRFRNIRLDA